MKITYQNFKSATKTRNEPSSLITGLWISRSAIGVNVNGQVQPYLGFSAGFNRQRCETGSSFELLERLIFSQYIYDETSLCGPVKYLSETLEPLEKSGYIREFLVGSAGPQKLFYGNGCAIFDNVRDAVLHSRRELIERHLCCEVWYKKTIQLTRDHLYKVIPLIPSVQIAFYTINKIIEGQFAIAVLECSETGFFVVGAAIRTNLKDAYEHALSEVAMIFEDFIKGRKGTSEREGSQKKILSLRDLEISKARKKHFGSLKMQIMEQDYAQPDYQTIVFEPLPGIYAARTFSGSASDPRLFEAEATLPALPLF